MSLMTVPAQEMWRVQTPERFTALGVEHGDVTCIYDGPCRADAEDVAEFWRRCHEGHALVVKGQWAS